MTAALRGKTEAVRALLAAGADRAALDANGRNAAFFGRRRPEIAALLGAPAGADAAPAAPVAVAAPMPNPNANAAAAPAPAAAPAAPPEPTISKEEASDALEP
jgi:hypothetical protein